MRTCEVSATAVGYRSVIATADSSHCQQQHGDGCSGLGCAPLSGLTELSVSLYHSLRPSLWAH